MFTEPSGEIVCDAYIEYGPILIGQNVNIVLHFFKDNHSSRYLLRRYDMEYSVSSVNNCLMDTSTGGMLI